MDGFVHLLQKYPEVAIFLSLVFGFWIGKYKIGKFGLGATVGTLVVALIIGQAHIQIPPLLRTFTFALFMFATGYRVGPQFFSGLRRGGMQMILLALVFCFVGLGVTLLMAKLFAFDKGLAAGLLSGALTQSSVIGTATDSINQMALTAAEKEKLASHVPLGDAVTYLFGAGGVALLLSQFAPKFLRGDLRQECTKKEKEMGGTTGEKPPPAVFDSYAAVDVEAIRATRERFIGLTVHFLEETIGQRVYVQRIRRGTQLITPRPDDVIQYGDILVLSGRREVLMQVRAEIGEEVVDRDAMDVPFETVPVIITKKEAIGKELGHLAEEAPGHAKGVHLRKILRQGQELPRLPETRLERGDILEVAGRREDINRVAEHVGFADRPSENSDIIFISAAIVLGTLVGMLAIRFGNIPVGLGTSGGVLVAGLVFGWLHSIYPRLGRIPGPAVWLMETVGLNVFIAVVGIGAGPHALAAMKDFGLQLLLAGVVVSVVPHLVLLFVGRYLLHMNLGVLLGASAGAGTATPSLQAVVAEARSSVPVLGFTIPYAISNVLLTAWGPVVVALA
jgi:putative transport protein